MSIFSEYDRPTKPAIEQCYDGQEFTVLGSLSAAQFDGGSEIFLDIVENSGKATHIGKPPYEDGLHRIFFVEAADGTINHMAKKGKHNGIQVTALIPGIDGYTVAGRINAHEKAVLKLNVNDTVYYGWASPGKRQSDASRHNASGPLHDKYRQIQDAVNLAAAKSRRHIGHRAVQNA